MRIGVFCSGGDAPGMNACLRAVVRTAITMGHEVLGVRRGYDGLLKEDFFFNPQCEPRMTLRSVSNIVQRGGTILQTSRCDEFLTEAGQQKAAGILRRHGIDALVPIGGDGTFHGAMALARFWDGPVIGCPGTIDNDLLGTDYTIGFHTAVATAVEAVDKLRDTAESHERMFLVEVMGRHSGHIAMYTALAAGAEIVCLPETRTELSRIVERICLLKQRGKRSIIVIVAEGDEEGGAQVLQKKLAEANCPFTARSVVLGHLQRGGSPVPADRLLATRLGELAVQAICRGQTAAMAGEVHGELVLTSFEEVYAGTKTVSPRLLELLDTMAH